MKNIVICALYKFVTFKNFRSFREPLYDVMNKNGLKGTLLLAEEGINGTIAGSREGIDNVIHWLKSHEPFKELECKESHTDQMPFIRSKIKLKKEIVTMGQPGIDPQKVVGTYVKPSEWNELISRDDVILIDTRNDYEVSIGTFKKALNPKTSSFRQFPKYVNENLDPSSHKKVAMFCTGGIRCEKSTAYLKELGFEEVYHLQGGIIKYLEDVKQENSLWEGECFVFDNRVTVDHSLRKGKYDQCHACRMPITEKEKESDTYQKGVTCPHCWNKISEQQKARFMEREKQVGLARQRGEEHIGSKMSSLMEKRRRAKKEKKELQKL